MSEQIQSFHQCRRFYADCPQDGNLMREFAYSLKNHLPDLTVFTILRDAHGNSILVTRMGSHFINSVKGNRRRLVAAFFLVCFFAHAGSHVVICASHSVGESSFSYSDRGHDDPCRTLVLCSDSRREGKQLRGSGHDMSQYNVLFDLSPQLSPPVELLESERIAHSAGVAVSRPPDPHFHPPQTS